MALRAALVYAGLAVLVTTVVAAPLMFFRLVACSATGTGCGDGGITVLGVGGTLGVVLLVVASACPKPKNRVS